MPRPRKKPDYDAKKLMDQLIDEVANAYLHHKIRGKELFFSRKEKSVTRATMDKAVKTVLELQRQRKEISGPKKLNCFGASYLYPVFIRIGLISETQFKSAGYYG